MNESKKIAESAKIIEKSAVDQVDSADRRTELAANRTVLASERTFTAWLRTGIAAFVSGLGTNVLFADRLPHVAAQAIATAFLLLGALCFGVSVWRIGRAGASPPTPDIPQISTPLLALVGILLVVISGVGICSVWLT